MLLLVRCRSFRWLPLVAISAACAAFLPAGCASARAPVARVEASDAPTVERIALAFAWPAGFAARVTGMESTRITSDLVESGSRSRLSYRVRLEPDPAGARIRYEDFAFPADGGEPMVKLSAVPGLEPLARALRPSFLVSSDGRFGGTPGLEDEVTAINRELTALHGRRDGLPAGAPPLPTLFSGEVFRRHAPAGWGPMVELWAGREIELGARYDVTLVTRMPLLDGAQIEMNGELRVSGRVACDEPGGPPRCVELVLVTRPDPLALLPLLGADGQRDGGGGSAAPVTVTRVELDETIRLVTEPETLIPHRVEATKRARVKLRLADGSVHTDALDQALDLVFHPGP